MKFNVMNYLKGIAALATTALAAFQVANADGHVTNAEWIQVVLATLSVAGTVWAVPNIPLKKDTTDSSSTTTTSP